MILTLDVENTVTKRNGKMHLDPFEPDNTLVMVGMLDDHMNETIVTFDHAEQQPTTDGRRIVQDALDSTRLLIAHNAPMILYGCGSQALLMTVISLIPC